MGLEDQDFLFFLLNHQLQHLVVLFKLVYLHFMIIHEVFRFFLVNLELLGQFLQLFS